MCEDNIVHGFSYLQLIGQLRLFGPKLREISVTDSKEMCLATDDQDGNEFYLKKLGQLFQVLLL